MTIYPAPKPEPREKAPKPKKPRTPLKRGDSARLSRSGPVKSLNVEATKKRRKRYRAEWRSPEQQAVRDEAFRRAGDRCEHVVTVGPWEHRCRETEKLEAHHLRYPKTRKLRASDLKILCAAHHQLEEMTTYSYRHRRAR